IEDPTKVLYITTARESAKKRPRHKLMRIIQKTKDPEEYNEIYTKIIVPYFKEMVKESPPPDDGNPEHLLILETRTHRRPIYYHSRGALLYKGLDEETYHLLTDVNNYLEILKKMREYLLEKGVISLTTDRNIGVYDGIVYSSLRQVSNEEIKVKIRKRYKNIEEIASYSILMRLFSKLIRENIPEYLPVHMSPCLRNKNVKIIVLCRSEFKQLIMQYFSKLKSLNKAILESYGYPEIEVIHHQLDDESYLKLINTPYKLISEIKNKNPSDNNSLLFVVTVVPPLNTMTFRFLKRTLLNKKILHQAINENTLRDAIKGKRNLDQIFASLFSQIYHKLGIYFFGMKLDEIKDFDMIVGLDIFKSEDISESHYGVSGGIVIQNREGYVITSRPISLPQSSSEIINMREMFSRIFSIEKVMTLFEETSGKEFRIVLFKDGEVYPDEIRSLQEFLRSSDDFSRIKLEVFEVIKSTPIRFFREDPKKPNPPKNAYFRLNNEWYVLPHYPRLYIKAPIKITRKFKVDRNEWVEEEVSETDIKFIVALSKI
ncbi:MAG TPA: hypothetical protein ENL09_00270, partial [Bacteroidetes bacterium]|nr:hypothetical protein [Bacteroidota bacterium]